MQIVSVEKYQYISNKFPSGPLLCISRILAIHPHRTENAYRHSHRVELFLERRAFGEHEAHGGAGDHVTRNGVDVAVALLLGARPGGATRGRGGTGQYMHG